MAVKIDDKGVDPRVSSVWKMALENYDATELQRFASLHPHLTTGFRKGKVSLPVVVTRIQAMLDRSGNLPVDLRVLLMYATLSKSLICVLAEEAISLSLPSLASAYGRANIFAALLLDERESIRKIGFEQMTNWDGTEPTEREQKEAVKSLQSVFRTFFEQMQGLVMDSVSSSRPIGSTSTGLAPKHDSKSAKMIVNLRQKRQESNKFRRELLDTKSERDRANNQVQELSVSVNAKTAELAKITKMHVGLNTHFCERVVQAVNKQLDHRLVPWLQPAENLAKAVAESTTGDLLQDAEDLLQRQTRSDLKYGLRSGLETQANQYRSLLRRLTTAMNESIRPLPEIGSTARQIKTRIVEIEGILNESSMTNVPDGQAPKLLVEKLQQAQSLEEVAIVRSGLLAIESVGLLAPEELKAAYALIGNVASRLYLHAGEGKSTKLGKVSLNGVPLYALQRQLAAGHKCIILIDGHNVLFKLSAIFGDYFERGGAGPKAQQALIETLVTLSQNQSSLIVNLWFDSGNAQDATLRENFKVHYSGGTGANRADKKIVEYLEYLHRSSPQLLRSLVTADRDLAAKAEATGALIVSPQEFAMLIS